MKIEISTHSLKSQSGSALLSVLIISLIAMVTIAIIMKASQHSLEKAGTRRAGVVLLNIAEAGNQDAIAKLKSNQVTLTAGSVFTISSNANFNGGAYTVVCSTGASADTLQLTSTATYMGKTKSIRLLCLFSTCLVSGEAFDYQICAGGNITWGGSGNLNALASAIRCNKSFLINGSSNVTGNIIAHDSIVKVGSCNIYGDVWAFKVKQSGSGSISGTIRNDPVPFISIPNINAAPYLAQATANSQLYNSDQHFTGSSNLIVPGGVIYVNGNFKRSGSGNFTGCIIATGNIELAGSGNYEKVDEMPLAVSLNGKVDFSGSGNIHGLLMAQNGDFEKSGSGNVTGAIICKGNLRKIGSWNFLTYEKSIPVAPGCSGNTFSILSWNEI